MIIVTYYKLLEGKKTYLLPKTYTVLSDYVVVVVEYTVLRS
jgi:hypothetical protein